MKIYGESLRPDLPYKTLLLSTTDSAAYVVKETLDKYGLEKENPSNYCLVQVRSLCAVLVLGVCIWVVDFIPSHTRTKKFNVMPVNVKTKLVAWDAVCFLALFARSRSPCVCRVLQVQVPPNGREMDGRAWGREEMLDDYDCPLAILMQHPPSKGTSCPLCGLVQSLIGENIFNSPITFCSCHLTL